MLLKLGGAGKLIALVRSEAKAKLSLQYGADVALDMTKEGAGLADSVRALTGGKGADITYECAGGSEAVNTCIDVTRSGGQIILLGVDGRPTSFVSARVIPHEIDLITSFVYDAAEVGMIFDFLANGKLPVAKKMVTDIIGMKDLVDKGLERLANPNDQTKILLVPHK
jgi:(R,R)-butanediol dehydrogenase/meso-butanediol dehydrogenase/diacetyl reductase